MGSGRALAPGEPHSPDPDAGLMEGREEDPSRELLRGAPTGWWVLEGIMTAPWHWEGSRCHLTPLP